MQKLLTASFVLFILSTSNIAQADLRCDGKIIRPQMSKRDIFQFCGPPSFNYSFTQEIQTKNSDSKETTTYKNIERLLYDTGSGAFLRTVELTNGEVHRISKHNEKGLSTTKKPNCLSDTDYFKKGLSAEVLGHLCGEPASKQLVKTEVSQIGESNRQIRTEEWVYMNRKKEITVTLYDGSIRNIEKSEF